MPERIDLVTAREAAERLAITDKAATKIIRTGMAGAIFQLQIAGRPPTEAVRADLVDDLAKWPWLQDHPGAFVVIMGAARNLDDQEGWLADRDNRDAVRSWWPCANPEDQQILVATVATFAVAVFKIVGWRRERGRVEFDIEGASHEIKKIFTGRRIPAKRGPVAYALPRNPPINDDNPPPGNRT
ncbi:MAG: hypothetical protein Q8P61_02160 [Candidatus Nanopelagicales bacterium]|nr:hypothetical protein [Candidatus Nanopelagicales bacterium]